MSKRKAGTIPQTDLIPDDKNANKGTPRGRGLLEDSLRNYGAGRSILTDRNGKIIAGNKTAEVAVGDLGMPTVIVESDGKSLIVVRRTDLDLDRDSAARELAYTDNRAGELSLAWDIEQMAEDMQDGLDLTELGFSQDEIDALLLNLGQDASQTGGTGAGAAELDPDELPETPARARTRPGDLWLLGPHKLLCGDSRDIDAVARFLGDEKIAVAVTSPPYADRRKYDESSPFRPVAPEAYLGWYAPVAASIRAHLADDGSYFLNIKAHSENSERLLYVLELVLAHRREWGWRFVDEFCWEKNGGVPGTWTNRFKNAWEPIYQFSAQGEIKFRPENVMVASDDVPYYLPTNKKTTSGLYTSNGTARPGMALPNNVLKVGAETRLTEFHSAPFPVGIPEFFIKGFSDVGDIVYDPFSGSGTTIVAAARTGRIGRAIEISPRYVDVTLDRFLTLTDTDPIRESDGVAWSDLRQETGE